MSSSVFTSPHQNWLDNSGKPLAGGRLYAYDAGTTTPTTTWQDAAHTQVNTNPVILDSGGFTTVWLDPTKSYRFRMENALGVQMWTVDNYQATSLTANILVPINYLLPATGTNSIDNGSNQQNWRWSMTGTAPDTALLIGETAPSTNTGANSDLVGIYTLTGSTISPFRATVSSGGAPPGTGLNVDPTGNVVAIGGAIFIGPVQIPSLVNQTALGTDNFGNIIAGTGGGGSGITGVSFADDEIVSGSGISFTLANTPVPAASLQLFQFLTGFGSVLLRQNIDYTLTGTAITTVNSVAAGNLTAWYRYAAATTPPPSTAPSVFSISPTSGSVAGGNQVTITGANFAAPAVVFFDSQTAPSVTVVNAAIITAIVPPAITTGGVTITVEVSGQSGQLTNSYVYTAIPAAQPIYSGVGGVGVAGATSVTSQSGNQVTLNTGDTLNQVQTTAETVNQIFSFATLNLNGQYIYLLLTQATHTLFWDQNSQSFPMNTPITVTVGGVTMYLYSSQNQMYGTTWTIQLRN